MLYTENRESRPPRETKYRLAQTKILVPIIPFLCLLKKTAKGADQEVLIWL